MQNKIILLFMFACVSYCSYATSLETIKIGTLIYNPPYEISLLSKHYSYGFNIDILNKICALIEKRCKLLPMRFDDIMPALNQGQVDAIMVGISLRPEHPESYAFSYPYFIGNAVFLTLSSDDFTSLNHKTIGVVENTLVPIHEFFDLIFVDNGLKRHQEIIQFKFFKSLPDLLEGLNKKEVNAVLLDSGAAQYWQDQSSGEYKVIGPVVSLHRGMMMVSLKQNTALIDMMNSALVEMEGNGELLAIYRKYWEAVYPYSHATGILLPVGGRKYQFITPMQAN